MNRSKHTALAIMFCAFAYGQKNYVADRYYEDFAYLKAAELYQELVKKGDSSVSVLYKLGDCYYNNANTAEAAKWYGLALNKDKKGNRNAEYIYKYIQTQRSLANYENANEWLKEFKKIAGNDSRAARFSEENKDYFKALLSSKGIYVKVTSLPFNTQYSDFGGYLNGNQLYFSSAGSHNDKSTKEKRYKWNEEPFLDLYQANLKDSTVIAINANDINTPFHEASVAITKDGKTLYFTRDNVNKRNKLSVDRTGTSHLKIYKATLMNGKWQQIKELPFNNPEYSVGHPALSPDEKKLYFVSDRNDGFGQTDIYEIDILGDDIYGSPKNLGNSVNTEGREMFPFISKDSILYFSSDGYLGLGLLDVYKSDILKKASSEPQNMGYPYNSTDDDFAFFVADGNTSGYFSSNREGSVGSDDIYHFENFECRQTIEGTVRDASNNQPLAAEVTIYDSTGKIISTVQSGANGYYSFPVDCDNKYTLKGSKPDYRDDIKRAETTDDNDAVLIVDLNLVPLISGNQIVLKTIFFDFDKWDVRPDAQYELENLVNVLKNHPSMVIKIESHTDCRGSDSYNMKLSQRRAESTRNYILSRGIEKNRIESAIGYGESQLLNECADGVKCSESRHQENRRSYFLILKE